MNNPIYIHGYVNPEYLNQFISGEITRLALYSKKYKSEQDTTHISVPIRKATEIEDAGFILERDNFIEGEEF